MAEFKTLDEAAFRKAASASKRKRTVRAVSARFDRRNHRITVRLDTGIEFSFAPRDAHGLSEATADDFVGMVIDGVGDTLHIPRLDADFSITRLLEGFLGPMDWSRQAARAAASRENGKLGGRPRKVSVPTP
ncbi:MAG: DUF2442 domain-containing protein [Caulobacter sp.]|nr:DUF2442 domain-containing protein [Caulobacter sp.]